jgi:hypothetical protein
MLDDYNKAVNYIPVKTPRDAAGPKMPSQQDLQNRLKMGLPAMGLFTDVSKYDPRNNPNFYQFLTDPYAPRAYANGGMVQHFAGGGPAVNTIGMDVAQAVLGARGVNTAGMTSDQLADAVNALGSDQVMVLPPANPTFDDRAYGRAHPGVNIIGEAISEYNLNQAGIDPRKLTTEQQAAELKKLSPNENFYVIPSYTPPPATGGTGGTGGTTPPVTGGTTPPVTGGTTPPATGGTTPPVTRPPVTTPPVTTPPVTTPPVTGGGGGVDITVPDLPGYVYQPAPVDTSPITNVPTAPGTNIPYVPLPVPQVQKVPGTYIPYSSLDSILGRNNPYSGFAGTSSGITPSDVGTSGVPMAPGTNIPYQPLPGGTVNTAPGTNIPYQPLPGFLNQAAPKADIIPFNAAYGNNKNLNSVMGQLPQGFTYNPNDYFGTTKAQTAIANNSNLTPTALGTTGSYIDRLGNTVAIPMINPITTFVKRAAGGLVGDEEDDDKESSGAKQMMKGYEQLTGPRQTQVVSSPNAQMVRSRQASQIVDKQGRPAGMSMSYGSMTTAQGPSQASPEQLATAKAMLSNLMRQNMTKRRFADGGEASNFTSGASAKAGAPVKMQAGGLLSRLRQGALKGTQAVDEAGKPVMAYRGEYGPSNSMSTNLGSYSFGTKEAANLYASEPNNAKATVEAMKVFPAQLSIRKPLINDPGDPFVDLKLLKQALGPKEFDRVVKKNIGFVEGTNAFEELADAKGYNSVLDLMKKNPKDLDNLYMEVYPILDDVKAVKTLQRKGYDGAIYGGSGATAHEPEYRVFSQSQAISPFGNKPMAPRSARQQLGDLARTLDISPTDALGFLGKVGGAAAFALSPSTLNEGEEEQLAKLRETVKRADGSPEQGEKLTFGDKYFVEPALDLYSRIMDQGSLPSNKRIFLESVRGGDRSQITEKNFNPSELAQMDEMVRGRYKGLEEPLTKYGQHLESALKGKLSKEEKSQYQSDLDMIKKFQVGQFTPGLMALAEGEEPSSARRRGLVMSGAAGDLAKLGKILPEVKYGDYPKGVVQESRSLSGGKTPTESLATSLGQFRYGLGPEGNFVIKDKYDFNPRVGSEALDAVPSVVTEGPYGRLREYAGRKMPPGLGRDVLVNLPKRADGSPKSGETAPAPRLTDLEKLTQESKKYPQYNDLMDFLASRQAVPEITQTYLGPSMGGQFISGWGEPKNGRIELNYETTPSTLLHELTHAADRQISHQASQLEDRHRKETPLLDYLGGKTVLTPEEVRLAMGYRKLHYDPIKDYKDPARYPRQQLMSKMAPEWAKENSDYRSGDGELVAYGMGSTVPRRSNRAPLHVDPTMATEFSILLDLAQRAQKVKPPTKK